MGASSRPALSVATGRHGCVSIIGPRLGARCLLPERADALACAPLRHRDLAAVGALASQQMAGWYAK